MIPEIVDNILRPGLVFAIAAWLTEKPDIAMAHNTERL